MKHWRVAEVFGPTIQGEGRQAGLPCYFIRFGGCDLRCSWCDTPHAVLPEQVAHLPKLDLVDIMLRLDSLPAGPEWVVISGGNPATLKLEEVVDELHARGYQVMVETQGTVFNAWLRKVDELCISPKPPSSGNVVTPRQLEDFITKNFPFMQHKQMYLKVAVFDNADYLYAQLIHKEWKNMDFFLSAGNEDPSLPTVGNPNPPQIIMGSPRDFTLDHVLPKFRWLAEKVARDPEMSGVRVLPQLHVIAWGNERGR